MRTALLPDQGNGSSSSPEPPSSSSFSALSSSGLSFPEGQVIARIRSHGRFLFVPSIIFIAVTGVIGATVSAWEQFEMEWMNSLFLVGCVLIVGLGVCVPMVVWLSRRCTVTTRRLIIRHGFFVRIRYELLHSRGYDVRVHQSWVQSIFRSGDVYITTPVGPPIRLRDIPRVAVFQAALNDLVEVNRVTENRIYVADGLDH